GVSSHQTEYPVGILPEGIPGLGAIDDVVVTFPHGRGLEGGKIGARIGLGIALAPPHIAGEDIRKEPLFLLLGTVGEDDRRYHLEAERNGFRCSQHGALTGEDVLLYRRPTSATMLHWPVRRCPAPVVENLLPAYIIVLYQTNVLIHLVLDIRRKFGLQKLANLLLELQFLCSKSGIHRCSPPRQCPSLRPTLAPFLGE